MNKKEMICNQLHCGHHVSIYLLTNNMEFSGTIIGFADDCILLRLDAGLDIPIAYSIIGTYKVNSFSLAKNDLEDTKVSLADLRKHLKSENPQCFALLSSKFDSLDNAIRIHEVEEKYGRTSPIVTAIISHLTGSHSGETLLAILGEVTLLTASQKYCAEALACFSKNWHRECYESPNLLRLLIELSCYVKNYDILHRLLMSCPDSQVDLCIKAMHYLLTLENITINPSLLYRKGDRNILKELFQSLYQKKADAPVSIPKPKTVEVTLEPFQAVATIAFYNESQHYGELKDEDGIPYRFVLNNVEPAVRDHLVCGTKVLFYRTTVYSPRLRRNVGAAERISLLPENAVVKQCPPEPRETGYIILYMRNRGSGYIIRSEDYGKLDRGDVFFEEKDIIGSSYLNTRSYHYKVTFSYVDPSFSTGTKRAKNVRIEERIPLNEEKLSNNLLFSSTEEDLDKLEILPEETLMIRDTSDNLFLGEFVSSGVHKLEVRIQGQKRIFAYWNIKEVMFFGVITSYNLLSESGTINGKYPFVNSNVSSVELSHLLRQSKFSTFLCMYSLRVADNNLYVQNVDYVSDALAKQLSWHSGRIQGEYQVKNFFSVENNNRCYISGVKDSTLLSQFNPPENMTFLQQEVFFRTVNHKPLDHSESEEKLIQSVLDIRLKYQLGKVGLNPYNPSAKKIQSGSYSYSCEQDLSKCENGTQVKLRLKLTEQNELVADYFDTNDLQLPNPYARNGTDGPPLSDQIYEFEMFSEEVPVSDMKFTTLLEFTRDSFDLNRVRPYLPKNYQSMIEKGQFWGTKADAEKLIRVLRNYRRKMGKDWESVPADIRPELILAAAHIHHQFCCDSTLDAFFSAEENTKTLVNYTYQHLTTGQVTEPSEVEYFSEIIFLNNFRDDYKNQMQARCLADCFAGMKNEQFEKFRDRNKIMSILRRKCINKSGLTQMLMNLPTDIFRNLLDCAQNLNDDTLLIEIAALVSPGFASDYQNVGNRAELCAETIRVYYQEFSRLKAKFGRDVSCDISMDDISSLMAKIEEAEDSFSRYLFNDDRLKLERIGKIVNGLSVALMNEDVTNKVSQLESSFITLSNVIRDIELHPSKFTFEILRDLAVRLQDALVKHLNQIYQLNQPKLKVEHFTLSGDRRRETVCVSNEPHCLAAQNIRVNTASAYGLDPGFVVDWAGNRKIIGEGKTVAGGKGIEIGIPIDVNDFGKREFLALTVSLTYERSSVFNPETGLPDTELHYLPEVNLQIPLTNNLNAPLTPRDNLYRAFAGGKEMEPGGRADKMFFGREEDIKTILNMLVDSEGELSAGAIVAIYGQKRCGKTSVMNFLGKKIRQKFSDALVLVANAQNVSRKDAYQGLLGAICSSLKTCWYGNPDLRKDMEQARLTIPTVEKIIAPGGESIFNAFFQEFRAVFGKRYPIVLMVDEFTQFYVLMKSGELSGDFLNRWRAMIQCNSFVNVVIGQDFMESFTTDEAITRLNYGGAVNGLGTMGRKRLSYLDFESAKKMMEDPIRTPSGASRYQEILGNEAIKRIYSLTGGSAFYLMKFCNALVNYMIDNKEQYVYTSLVETVADNYVFDTRDNPITKTDFDPIYNAYSYDAAPNASNQEEMDNEAQMEMNKSYQMLKLIADNSNRVGVCNTNSIPWPNSEEKARILRTLRIRGVLSDANGNEIKSENMENVNVKITVGLFSIWLKKRG